MDNPTQGADPAPVDITAQVAGSVQTLGGVAEAVTTGFVGLLDKIDGDAAAIKATLATMERPTSLFHVQTDIASLKELLAQLAGIAADIATSLRALGLATVPPA
jgi:hypothetical protein